MWKKEHWTGKTAAVLMGLFAAYLITLLGILLLAFALYQWGMSVEMAEISVLVLYCLSCLIGGMICGKKAENRKFLWGLLLGVCYFLVLLLISVTSVQGISTRMQEIILPGCICVFSGMLGGMLV